ncbi:MAG: hypothetical protein FJ102_06355 [Deltaproteobacteria bacterium]|nr:hypothetical protein [Deltaproteobacteria bacterium]
MLTLFDADLVGWMGTMAVALALVGGAALALWSLPWTDAELDALDRDARQVARKWNTILRPGEPARRANIAGPARARVQPSPS